MENNELYHSIHQDAPPRKKRTREVSPHCELFEMVAPPLASTSAAVDCGSNTTEESLSDLSIDPDSDIDIHDDDEIYDQPQPVHRDMEMCNNMTLQLEEILKMEDRKNDIVLKALLPEYCSTFDWSNDKQEFEGKRETFFGKPGPTFDMSNMIPIDIFEKMFDAEFLDLLCRETNRYASQIVKMKRNVSPRSRLNRWIPTDRAEMISFLALTIIQGLYPISNEESSFKFNGFGTMPYIPRIMSYNRYIVLKTMLHFVNNDERTDRLQQTKLYKIQPIVDYFNEKFSSLYYPQQEITIDESLLKWHGKLNFTQKIKTIASQVGVKIYELSESSSGYIWRFSVHTGKDKTATDNDDDHRQEQTDTQDGQEQKYRSTNATANIVLDLIDPLLYRGHTVIMDNFYNCPLLARCLKRWNTDCYGTQRLNRDFMPNSFKNLTKTELKHKEILSSFFCSDLCVLVWRDSNLVSMISTYHRLNIGTRETYKPSVVLDYNKYMGGVDRKDNFLSAQPLKRIGNQVWYKELFRRLFNCAVFNCFVMYNAKHKMQHRRFRTTLAETLLKKYRQIDLTTETRLICRTYGQSSRPVLHCKSTLKIDNRPIVDSDHFPVHSPTKRGRCWWCSNKRKTRSRTIWMCKECCVNLCILDCFRAYHKP